MSLRARLTALSLVLLLGSLTACSTDLTEEAEALKQQIGALDQVQSSDVSYSWGTILTVGAVNFEVTMDRDATTDDAADVIGTVFDEFASTYRNENAKLSVRMGDESQILLNASKTDAKKAEVLAVARFALDSRRTGETVEADIDASSTFDQQLFASSDVMLHLGPGSTISDVLPRLDGVAEAGDLPAHTDFGVLAADRAGLAGSPGLPSDEDRREWRALSRVDFPGTMRVDSGPYKVSPVVPRHVVVDVNLTRPRRQESLAPELGPLIRAHLAVLGSHRSRFMYKVTMKGLDIMSMDSHDCDLARFPAWQAEVIRDFFASTDACQYSTARTERPGLRPPGE